MKKCKKVLALVLALLMLVSAVSVGFSAFASQNGKSIYTGSGLKTSMNSVDEYELDNQQYCSMILEFADKTLAEMNIKPMTIKITDGAVISVNLQSVDGLVDTILSVKKVVSSNASLIKEIGDFNFSYITADLSRGNNPTKTGDEALIKAFVQFLSDETNANLIKKAVQKGIGTSDGQLNPGNIVNGFLPDAVHDLDIVKMIKEGVFNNANVKFDDGIADLITEILNNMNLEQLDGYKFVKTDSIYLTIDKVVRALTKWAVKQLQEDAWNIEESILGAMPTFKEDYPFVDLQGLTRVNWTWEGDGCTTFTPGQPKTYLVYHINNLIGHIVDKVFPEFSEQYTWTKDNSTNSLNTLDNNIAKAAEYADKKLNGGTFTAEEISGLSATAKRKAYAMVLADALLKMFFPGIKIDKEDIKAGNICKLAVMALNELFSYYLPNEYIDDLYTYTESSTGTIISFNSSKYPESTCKTLYKQMAAQAISKFATGYFPVTFSTSESKNIDSVAKVMLSYFLNTVCKAGNKSEGAIGTVSSSDTAYSAIDRIIFSYKNGSYVEGASPSGGRNNSGILPKGFLPSAYSTTESIKNLLFSAVENLSIGSLLGVLIPNSSDTEMNTAVFPELATWEVIRIINVIFPGTWTSKTSSLDTLITNDNLGTILYKILRNLDMDYHVRPGVKLACFVLGLSTPQKRGEADISLAMAASGAFTEIGNVIPATSTSIPAGYYIKVSNTTKGINTGYHNGGNSGAEEVQDALYKLKVKSIVCENDSGVTVNASETVINDNESAGFAISGTLTDSPKKVLSFLVKYQMSLENGRNYSENEIESRLYVYAGMPDSTTITSGTVVATIPKTIYGSPSMINNAIGLLRTTDVNSSITAAAKDYSTYPTSLTNAGISLSATDPGSPASAINKPFNPVSISVPGSVDISRYYGSHTMTYTMESKNPSQEGSDYGSPASANVNLVLFDDAGLPSLFSKYTGMDLQTKDFSDTALWSAFQSELIKAAVMINNPSAYGSTPSALTTAYTNEVQALTTAYEKLAKSSNVDYTDALNQRINTYADGNEADNIRALYPMWDYTPVSYARFSSSMSTIRDYKSKNESSSIRIEEALRFNDVMKDRLFTSDKTDSDKAAARQNLIDLLGKFVRTQYSADVYTYGSYQALMKAFDDAEAAKNNYTALDGTVGAARTSDYADARTEILEALNKLTEQPLKGEDLSNLISRVNAIKAGTGLHDNQFDNMYYTDETWNALETALANADVAINDPFTFINPAGEEPTPAEIATAKAKLGTLLSDINTAFNNLENYKSVLELKNPDQEGYVTFKEGQKVIVGSKIIEGDDYVILPYGAGVAVNNIKNLYKMSENVSHYTKDDKGKWNTYSTAGSDFDVTVLQSKTSTRAVTSGLLKTGHAIKIVDGNSNTKIYVVVITGNTGSASSAARWATAPTDVAKVLPNVIANVGVASISDEKLLACDLNSDGVVDITDMALLKKWQAGTYEPYNVI